MYKFLQLKSLLAVFKSPTSVQLLPSHTSVCALIGGVPPARYTSELLLPPVLPPERDVFKSAISVQELPFQDSVTPLGDPSVATADV